MIRFTFFEHEDTLQGYCVLGHANFAPKGKDTVCASVSALAIYTANLLGKMGFSLDFDDTSDRFMVIVKEQAEKAQSILSTLKATVEEIEEHFPKNLKVEVKANVVLHEYSAICREESQRGRS